MNSTITDVAKRAGVSVSTVSNVINNKTSVSKDLRARVLKAVEELKYQPNRFARGLPRRKRSKDSFVTIIGLSIPHYYVQGLKALAAGVKYGAREIGAQIIEYLTENDSERQMKQIAEKIQRKVDAIICFPVDCKKIEKSIEDCNLANIPFISLNRLAYGDVYAVVKSDDYKAGNDLGLYAAFKFKGKKGKILEIEGEITDLNSLQRSIGFNDVIKNWPGMEVVCKHRCDWNMEKAKKATIKALRDYPDINIIYSHNDEMAKGALVATKELGRDHPIDHPHHIMLLGVDGDKFALDNIRTGLFDATSEQLLWEQGTKAVDLVMAALNGEVIHNSVVLVPTSLVNRDNVDFIKDHWAEYDIDFNPNFSKRHKLSLP